MWLVGLLSFCGHEMGPARLPLLVSIDEMGVWFNFDLDCSVLKLWDTSLFRCSPTYSSKLPPFLLILLFLPLSLMPASLERLTTMARDIMRSMESAGKMPSMLLNDKGLLILGDGLEQWKDRLDEV